MHIYTHNCIDNEQSPDHPNPNPEMFHELLFLCNEKTEACFRMRSLNAFKFRSRWFGNLRGVGGRKGPSI